MRALVAAAILLLAAAAPARPSPGWPVEEGLYAIYVVGGEPSDAVVFVVEPSSPLLNLSGLYHVYEDEDAGLVVAWFNASAAWLGVNVTRVHPDGSFDAVVWLRVGGLDDVANTVARPVRVYPNGTFVAPGGRGVWAFMLPPGAAEGGALATAIEPPFEGDGRVVRALELCVTPADERAVVPTPYGNFTRYVALFYNVSGRYASEWARFGFHRQSALYDAATGLLIAADPVNDVLRLLFGVVYAWAVPPPGQRPPAPLHPVRLYATNAAGVERGLEPCEAPFARDLMTGEVVAPTPAGGGAAARASGLVEQPAWAALALAAAALGAALAALAALRILRRG